MSEQHRFTSAADAKTFALGGNATLTLVSTATGARFTYRLRASDDGQVHFVSLLSGPDNNANYSYLGRISRDIFHVGRKNPKPGDTGFGAPSCKAFAWAWQRLMQDTLPDSLEIWHEGRCGRCARKLTVPSSIASGFGPECAGRVGFLAEAC